MNISLNWLRTLIPLNETHDRIDELLTGCGLEVESIDNWQSVKGGLQGVITGQVLTCTQHPNADRLKLTTVDTGREAPLHIVCGAPNVQAGQKVLVATVGCTLYPAGGDALTLKETKIRGEISQGMICAEDELGLGQSHAGILVLPDETPLGMPAADLFGVETDAVISIGLTANRGDAASHLGVAIDLAALLQRDITLPETAEPAGPDVLQITLDETGFCRRYSALLMQGVSVKDSPAWLQNRLKAIGLSPINNVVDCTNYVMHELGQPLHAFDADNSGNHIVLRLAREGETIETLDGRQRNLKGHELLVCNPQQPLALAGVFGGKESGVSPSTTNLLLESAWFDPATVRKAARAHDLSTDASFRFERSTDPEMTVFALKRLALLIQQTAGGQPASAIADRYPNPLPPVEIAFSLSRFYKLAGLHIPLETITAILTRLGIHIQSHEGDILQLQVPPRKADVTRPADVAEEIIRIYGLNNIPFPAQMRSNSSPGDEDAIAAFTEKAADYLAANGWHEILTNSLTKAQVAANPARQAVQLKNPLSSELDTLRTSLLPGCLQAVAYNRNRRQPDVKVFEFGRVYGKAEGGYTEEQHLMLVCCGLQQPETWLGVQRPADLFLLKSIVKNLLQLAGIAVDETIETHADTQVIVCSHSGNKLAWISAVPIDLAATFDVDVPVMQAWMNWDAVSKMATEHKVRYRPVNKFPFVRRDLALVLNEDVTYAAVRRVASGIGKNLLKRLDCFDVYRGEKLAGKKSYAVSFVFEDEEKTLTDEQVDSTMKKLMTAFEKELGAEIRS